MVHCTLPPNCVWISCGLPLRVPCITSRCVALLTPDRAIGQRQEQRMLRDDIKAAQISAMKGGDKDRTAALRMISAKIKDRDIELRGKDAGDDDALVTDVLQKMAKQRRESIAMYEDGGRDELAAAEKAELSVIEEYLPAQMSDADMTAAIEAIKTETGADGMKDMGKVMGLLKQRHGGEMDMGKASAAVKAALG